MAITEIATANVDIWFFVMKKSRDDSIFVRLSITEVTVITKKYRAKTSQSRVEKLLCITVAHFFYVIVLFFCLILKFS